MCISAAASLEHGGKNIIFRITEEKEEVELAGRCDDEPRITVENHLYLHVQILLGGNLPYSCFNTPCHLLLLKHIFSPYTLALSLKRTVHEEHF